jgi:hypothetical protein
MTLNGTNFILFIYVRILKDGAATAGLLLRGRAMRQSNWTTFCKANAQIPRCSVYGFM